MPNLLVVLSVSFLTACVAYKVEAVPETDSTKVVGESITEKNVKIEHVQRYEYPEGFQCFEPMLYVLSLGIIPAHCVDRYIVSFEESEGGVEDLIRTEYKVTRMQGWFMLFLPPFPAWRFGYGEDVEAEIIALFIQTDDEA